MSHPASSRSGEGYNLSADIGSCGPRTPLGTAQVTIFEVRKKPSVSLYRLNLIGGEFATIDLVSEGW